MKKIFSLLPLLCICACSSINNKEQEPISQTDITVDNTPLYSQDINKGKIEVYHFSSYSSVAYYHILTTYDAPCSIETYSNYFKIDKDSVSYYYSMPMFQYSFSV